MTKLVFDYTSCSEPECWEINIPFEYTSKEKFIFDVIDNPKLLTQLNIYDVYEYQIEEKMLPECVENIDQYVFTLDEWFEKNCVNKKKNN